MENHTEELNRHSRRPPWNKGKLIGAKPPLRPMSRLVHKNQASIDASRSQRRSTSEAMHSLADLVGLGLADYVVGDFRFWDLAAMSQRCDAEKAEVQ